MLISAVWEDTSLYLLLFEAIKEFVSPHTVGLKNVCLLHDAPQFYAHEKIQELIVDMNFHLSDYIRYDGYFQSCEIEYMH